MSLTRRNMKYAAETSLFTKESFVMSFMQMQEESKYKCICNNYAGTNKALKVLTVLIFPDK